jgi:hypothetical protein
MQLRTPLIILLLLGIGLGFSLPIPSAVVRAVAVLFLALVAYESVARIKTVDGLSAKIRDWTIVFAVFKMLTFTVVGYYLGLPWIDAALLASLLLSVADNHPFLALESVWSSPIATLLPFVILAFLDPSVPLSFQDQFFALALRMLTGIGVGVVGGMLLLSAAHRTRNSWHPFLALVAALFVFFVSQYFGGFGLLGVVTLGIFAGRTAVKKSLTLEGPFLDVVAAIGIVLLGMLVQIPRTAEFLHITLILLGVSIVIRFVALKVCRVKKDVLRLTLAPRGLPMAAVLLALAANQLASPYVVALGVALLVGFNVVALIGKRFS